MTEPKTYTVTLTPQELATIQVALLAEVEHARDAARSDDPIVEKHMLAVADRNEALWDRLSRVHGAGR